MMCSQLLNESPGGRKIPLSISEIRRRNPSFGTSLLLSNSPMTPKVMNGSFVAIFENGDGLKEFLDRNGILRIACKDSPVLQRRLKGLLRGIRQYSLDSHIDLMVVERAAKLRTRNNSLGDAIDEQSQLEDTSTEDVTLCDKCGQKITKAENWIYVNTMGTGKVGQERAIVQITDQFNNLNIFLSSDFEKVAEFILVKM